MDDKETKPNIFTWIFIALFLIGIYFYVTSDFYKWVHEQPPRPHNHYPRKAPVIHEVRDYQPKKRVRVEPDDSPTLLDIEDEVDRNGDDNLEYYDYILK